MGYQHGWRKDLYDRAPHVLKNAITTAYGFQQRRVRYGETYRRFVDQLRRDERTDSATLRARQLASVRAFLIGAQRTSPFHRARFTAVGFDPEALTSLDQLSVLPITTKEDVRRDTARITSERVRELDVRMLHTSGTTGKALSFPMSSAGFQREYAFRASHYAWAGVSLDDREPMAFVAGHPVAPVDRMTPPFWSYDHANRWLLMSSYHLSERNLPAYIRELERYQPVMLAGYPSSISLIAHAWSRWGRTRLPLRAVFTSSETLLDHQRHAIEAAFQTKVFMWYGTMEMCANIVECERGSYHGRLEHSYVEVLGPDDQPAQEGRLVCTAFGNEAFPLVRYDVGDVVARSTATACPCGRPGELFERIIGRTDDYIVTPDGRYIGRLSQLFKETPNVYEAQLVQRELGEVVIRIVRRPAYDSTDEQQIRRTAQMRLGSAIALRFEYVEAIDRASNGKFKFIVSALRDAPASSVASQPRT